MSLKYSRGYRQPPPESVRRAQGNACPRCNGATYRVSRRFIDRMFSMLVPLHRHRCWSVECGWEGVLRIRPLPSANGAHR